MTFIMMIIVMMAGTGVIMWLGELITERGIGNGMSLLISLDCRSSARAASLASARLASGVRSLRSVALLLVVAIAVVYIEQAQRRIPVQYAKRMIGRRQYGGTTTYIPLKINMSGVIPVIFASSILAAASDDRSVRQASDAWVQWISSHFTQGSGFYLTIYGLMTLFFAFFYTAITFNPDEVADNMKKYGGFIPGYRAGRPTAEYLRFVINRITTAGALYLVIIALLPSFAIIPLKLSSSQMPSVVRRSSSSSALACRR